MSDWVAAIRRHFPSLGLQIKGEAAAFFDGPGGTQVPSAVIEAMATYFQEANANTHGAFLTSRRTDEMLQEARSTVAAFLGAAPHEIAFGANMTTLNYALSRALGRLLSPGDTVLITDMDHEANRGPWLALAEKGIRILRAPIDRQRAILHEEAFLRLLEERPRIVAVGWASNAVGSIPDLPRLLQRARDVGAITVVDAVHYAPHYPMDVKAMAVDFLLCSAYKFFGPHVGILYGREEVFRELPTYKLLPQEDAIPYRIETGTLNHEGIWGTQAAIRWIASLAQKEGSLRAQLEASMEAIARHEEELFAVLWKALAQMADITLYGPGPEAPRTPTLGFTHARHSPREVASRLAEKGLFIWDGDFYATTLMAELGLQERGGLCRIGLAPYNTMEEVERLLQAIEDL
ncbi:MAG: cysteine desulfurase-like protein [Bacillota bacterium]|nr:cysteine desulfurase-like protein [Bacillota bacterium]